MAELRRSGPIRCAVYTRKSSEEGLEQSFNSLHAQRDACEAFVRSQQHEGWSIVPTAYDDGGFSGGTMERPGLKALLDDVRSGKVNVVVVYKIDRLTRSLFDFAKIVETLDAAGASFVSVTQSFNTTTSMGRLTLNVLLSFAQFEREVTGERIRDKIAASKRKGMFMGGNIPIGYDLVDHRLVPNPDEAATVRLIFETYLQRGTVRQVKQHLDRTSVVTKRREVTSTDGTKRANGGLPFFTGHLYTILRNPVYIGKVRHRREVHAGIHDPIISDELWAAVQARFDAQAVGRSKGRPTRQTSLLTGILFTEDGRRLTPTHTVKGPNRYSYYATTASVAEGGAMRLSARDIEQLVRDAVATKLTDNTWLSDLVRVDGDLPANFATIIETASALATQLKPMENCELRALIDKVGVAPQAVRIHLNRVALLDRIGAGVSATEDHDRTIEIDVPTALRRKGREQRLVLTSASSDKTADPMLMTAISRSRRWFELIADRKVETIAELADREGVARAWISNQLPLAFLAPDIVRAIMQGDQPSTLTLDRLIAIAARSDWFEQRAAFARL